MMNNDEKSVKQLFVVSLVGFILMITLLLMM
jgi:hypothetical protein